jgi:hypothetical protein
VLHVFPVSYFFLYKSTSSGGAELWLFYKKSTRCRCHEVAYVFYRSNKPMFNSKVIRWSLVLGIVFAGMHTLIEAKSSRQRAVNNTHSSRWQAARRSAEYERLSLMLEEYNPSLHQQFVTHAGRVMTRTGLKGSDKKALQSFLKAVAADADVHPADKKAIQQFFKSGLSTGAKIGIGVGSAVATAALATLVAIAARNGISQGLRGALGVVGAVGMPTGSAHATSPMTSANDSLSLTTPDAGASAGASAGGGAVTPSESSYFGGSGMAGAGAGSGASAIAQIEQNGKQKVFKALNYWRSKSIQDALLLKDLNKLIIDPSLIEQPDPYNEGSNIPASYVTLAACLKEYSGSVHSGDYEGLKRYLERRGYAVESKMARRGPTMGNIALVCTKASLEPVVIKLVKNPIQSTLMAYRVARLLPCEYEKYLQRKTDFSGHSVNSALRDARRAFIPVEPAHTYMVQVGSGGWVQLQESVIAGTNLYKLPRLNPYLTSEVIDQLIITESLVGTYDLNADNIGIIDRNDRKVIKLFDLERIRPSGGQKISPKRYFLKTVVDQYKDLTNVECERNSYIERLEAWVERSEQAPAVTGVGAGAPVSSS